MDQNPAMLVPTAPLRGGCFGTEPVALVREVRPACGGQRRHEGRNCPVVPDAGDRQAAPGGGATWRRNRPLFPARGRLAGCTAGYRSL